MPKNSNTKTPLPTAVSSLKERKQVSIKVNIVALKPSKLVTFDRLRSYLDSALSKSFCANANSYSKRVNENFFSFTHFSNSEIKSSTSSSQSTFFIAGNPKASANSARKSIEFSASKKLAPFCFFSSIRDNSFS